MFFTQTELPIYNEELYYHIIDDTDEEGGDYGGLDVSSDDLKTILTHCI